MGLKILLCDDHQIMLDGLKSILKNGKEFDEIYTCLHANEALKVLDETQIDLALIDINLPGMNGIELTEKIKAEFPYTKVIILSMNNALGSIQQALDAGAAGYILKNTDRKELLDAIKVVMAKGIYYSREVSDILISNLMTYKEIKKEDAKIFDLTPREIEIIKLIIKEYSNQKIADALFISEHTVETHRKNIFRKTNTKTLVGLVKFAFEIKILD
ncbi:MAG: response regulator [Cytophagales bacterium]